jgi:hypothetical protein
MYSGNIEEVPDADREVIVKGIYPKDYHPAEYSCYEKWELPHNTNELIEKKCPANQWKSHKDGVHPEIIKINERQHQDRMVIVRWAIGTILTVIVLGLTVYNIFFKK